MNKYYRKWRRKKLKKDQEYERAGVLSIEEVFSHVGKKEHIFWVGNTPFKIKVFSLRHRVFKTKGIKCVKCGVTGTHFAIERHKGQEGRYHLNLYATNSEGQEILMTKDHVIPTSKGGPNTLDNLQPMCVCCNVEKGDSYE